MHWFKRHPRRVYLDWAGSAPVAPAARRAFRRTLGSFGNPSAPHEEGTTAKQVLEEARTTVAQLTETKPDGIIFTSGATEANNLAVRGIIQAFLDDGVEPGDLHVLYLPSAHVSVVKPVQELARLGVLTEPIILAGGAIDSESFKRQLTSQTCLVLIDAVCGETGTRFATRAMRAALDAFAREAGIPRAFLHVDASQLPFIGSVSLTHLGADAMTLDAQKIGGVRGIGALCVRGNVPLAAVLLGGGQERGRRPGTEPVALAAGFAAALTQAQREHKKFVIRAARMRQSFIEVLFRERVAFEVNTGAVQAPHILNLSFLDLDTDYLLMLLDHDGFAVSTKSACESNGEDGSRAVLALTGCRQHAQSTLRISWGPTTHTRELNRFASALVGRIRFMNKNSL